MPRGRRCTRRPRAWHAHAPASDRSRQPGALHRFPRFLRSRTCAWRADIHCLAPGMPARPTHRERKMFISDIRIRATPRLPLHPLKRQKNARCESGRGMQGHGSTGDWPLADQQASHGSSRGRVRYLAPAPDLRDSRLARLAQGHQIARANRPCALSVMHQAILALHVPAAHVLISTGHAVPSAREAANWMAFAWKMNH